MKTIIRTIAIGCILVPQSLDAQIVPDATLPVNSQVNSQCTSCIINGGTVRDGNLFHSFKEFSIPTGGQVIFNNDYNIQNILTRITGNSVSNIDGLIRTGGIANLFLLNPNGIIFGANAKLDIGGAFIATTANSLLFSDGVEFSAINPPANPLLTISVPMGLNLKNPGEITLEGAGHNLKANDPVFSPIQAIPSQAITTRPQGNIAIIGGNINFNGGVLQARGGNIQLSSIRDGIVTLISKAQGYGFEYNQVKEFDNIQLSNRALVDVSGVSAGQIQANSKNLRINNGSLLFAQNFGSQAGGSINVNTTQSVELKGTTGDGNIGSGLRAETLAKGASGNIDIVTGRLILDGGASINTRTYGSGGSGKISINAKESLLVNGFAPINKAASIIISLTVSEGNAGNAIVSAPKISMLNGGSIIAATVGAGSGANLTVNANDIQISGTAGTVQPSTFSASTAASGKAGQITVNTNTLEIQKGGSVSSSSYSSGAAGDITINASEFVRLTGRAEQVNLNSQITSGVTSLTPGLQSLLRQTAIPTGAAGNIIVNTPNLYLANEGRVTVTNTGKGDAGKIKLTADSLLLENQASIAATTASGQGGNIFLQIGDLQIRQNSLISATSKGQGDGGNLSINADTIALLEQGNISANATQGKGGNINITTQALFRSLDSDITASSELGINGNITINTINTDPSQGLVELPQFSTDKGTQIAVNCAAASVNKFAITGRGGLPQNPTDVLTGNTTFIEVINLAPSSNHRDIKVMSQKYLKSFNSQPTEAQGWVVNNKGEVILVAEALNAINQPYNAYASCHSK